MSSIRWLFTGQEFEYIPASGTPVDPIPGRYVLAPNAGGIDPYYDGPGGGPLALYDQWGSVGIPDPSLRPYGGEYAGETVPNWPVYERVRDLGWRLGESFIGANVSIRNVYAYRRGDWVAIGEPVIVNNNDAAFSAVFAVLVSVATAGAASQIGAAIIGSELAAAYPALSHAVGSVAVNTATNGGDVESAVKGSVTGLSAGYVGQNVAASLDSVAAGRAAAAATAAMIRDGDIKSAVGQSLLQSTVESGGSMFADAFAQQDYSQPVNSDYGYGTDAGIVPINDGDFMQPTEPLQDFFGVGDPSQTAVFDYAYGGSIETGFSSPAPDSGIVGIDIPVYTQTPPVVIDDGAPGGFGESALDFLTQAAIAAIKVNQAYQASQRPPVRVNTNPASGAPRPTPGGMLVTQNPLTGQVQTARPAVGVPYALGDGRTMINNGDGTFSLITANGQTSRVQYGAGAGAAPDYAQWALYGALGLAVVLAVRK